MLRDSTINLLKFGIALAFIMLELLFVYGLYKYMKWLFSVPLLSTAGIMGIVIGLMAMAGCFLFFCVVLGAIKGLIEA